MKTKNLYAKPIEEQYLTKAKKGPGKGLSILTREAPGHTIFEHNSIVYDLTYAVDFICPIKTPVKAGLYGEVFDTKNDVTKSWDKITEPPTSIMRPEEQDGNFVVIKHPGDEFSIYSHLSEVSVRKGQKVHTGDIIGYSGNSGWSIEPHLHFMVFKFLKDYDASRGLKSLEVRWK
ncbi:MAG: M23 family metallopeptidase [Candidatus Aenigmarchaeota archaeon]|nr:M23 family metallopeptidase [Candidatus Aenigmarchaeota archaeon]